MIIFDVFSASMFFSFLLSIFCLLYTSVQDRQED
jgi:hypothetical protein